MSRFTIDVHSRCRHEIVEAFPVGYVGGPFSRQFTVTYVIYALMDALGSKDASLWLDCLLHVCTIFSLYGCVHVPLVCT